MVVFGFLRCLWILLYLILVCEFVYSGVVGWESVFLSWMLVVVDGLRVDSVLVVVVLR